MALHLLYPQQYARIRPLFDERITPSLYDQGILLGKYPGKVIVDDVDQPRSALVIKDLWCHLIGDPTNLPFTTALQMALAKKQFIGEKTSTLFFIDPTEAWGHVLNGLIENRQPIETPRHVYAANPGYRIPTPKLPEEYKLQCIDESLRDLVDGELPEDVQKVLTLRMGANRPDEIGFGYVAIHGRSCAAWAVVDFIVGRTGEIRLMTDAQHRRRGLAFITSAATIRHGLDHGLNQIDWDVAASNIGSIRTAEKLGLNRLRQTKEFILIFPEVGYLINLAWSHLDSQRFEQTQVVAETMINSDKEVLVQYGHFLAGAAWAGLAHPAKAIEHINQAIDAGFNDLPELENCPSLTILYGSPEWDALVARINP